MHSTYGWRLASALFLCGGLFGANQLAGAHSSVANAAGTANRVTLNTIGTVNFPVGGVTNATLTTSELAPSGDTDADNTYPTIVDRTLGASKGTGRTGVGASRAKSNPNLVQSFDGLNLFQERYAGPDGGNFQFEPPDQALCAGNGYVVDGVNDAMSIYRQSDGARVAGPTTLNSFLGFAPELNRTTGVYGPETTDPVCYYDADSGRFFYTILTLDLASNGAWYGGNEEDIAVSNSGDPTGSWTVYRLDVTGDGASGCPCLGDYPHIGADANGFYITTNDFPLVEDGFNGSHVYAFSKQGLISGTNLNGWVFDTSASNYTVTGDAGYSVWPATAPSGKYETGANGTEYFLSSTYDNCAACTTSDNRIAVWALTNTSYLSGSNQPTLRNTTVSVSPYADPPNATQKDRTASSDIPYGSLYYGAVHPGVIATNDSRNLTAVYANGKLWGALTTGVTVGSQYEAGIAYYIIVPSVANGVLSAKTALQGTLAASNANVIFPSIGVTASGRGVMSYTLTGANDWPSAAYSSLDAKAGAGPITVAAAGVGPSDGFTEYQPYYSNGDPRPRWGDYGAVAVDGTNVWTASEYVGQHCSVSQYLADFTCGGTRGSAANWSTRITELNLHQ